MTSQKVVVSDQPAFVEYLREIKLIDEDTPILGKDANAHDVRHRALICCGECPLRLAVVAWSVVCIDVDGLDRGHKLSLAEIRKRACDPIEYQVSNWPGGADGYLEEWRRELACAEAKRKYGTSDNRELVRRWAAEHRLALAEDGGGGDNRAVKISVRVEAPWGVGYYSLREI